MRRPPSLLMVPATVGALALAASVLAPVGVVVLGLTTGLVYGLLAFGLVLVYKANRFINFAHGEVGAFSSLLLAKLVLDLGWNYWLALPVALSLGVLVGMVFARVVVRPLARAPRMVLMVATMGVAQAIVGMNLLWDGLRPDPAMVVAHGYPTPLSWSITVGQVRLGGAQFMILLVVPLLAVVGALFFRYSTLGLSIRAVAVNPDAARLAGLSMPRITMQTWMIAGGLSGLTAILLAPSASTYSVQVLGPGLMVRALTAAVLARMSNLPAALAAGVGLGVAEQVVFWRYPAGGTSELALFLMLLGGLLVFGRALSNETGADRLEFRTRPPRPRHPRHAFRVNRAGLAVAGAAAVLLPMWLGESDVYRLTNVVVYAIVGLALSALLGWSGQLSLGHFAFVGIGAYTAAALDPGQPSIVVGLLVAAAAGAATALVLGLPTLRMQGAQLAVATLAFAVVCQGWAFQQPGFGSQQLGTPTLAATPLRSQRALYYVALAVFTFAALGLRALRSSGPGRLWVAARDNELQLASNGTSPFRVRLSAFTVSGALAATAGALWAYANRNFDSNSFAPQQSIGLISMVVVGGVGSLSGAVVGAAVVFGAPILIHLDAAWSLLLGGIVVPIVLARRPDGNVSLFWSLRDWLVRVAGRGAVAVDEVGAVASPPAVEPLRRSSKESKAVPLECEGVTVRFGGVLAVDALSLVVERQATLGLIGANGAGKTTLMNAISGFVSTASGRVSINGIDATRLRPEDRRSCGLGRGFQDASLYGGLTVRETVLVALEPELRAGTLSSFVNAPWVRWFETAKRREADAILDELGLFPYADREIAELSTGLRRACALAATLAERPSVLLLDEPTAGLAQREVEAFVPLLRRVQAELGCATVLIEHDIGVVMSLSDTIVVMEAGRMIAAGEPAQIRSDPRVIASYLGRNDASIQRSNAGELGRT